MKRPGRYGLWVGAALIASLIALKLLFRPTSAEVPAAALFPDQVSVALKVARVEERLERHWLARGAADSGPAFEELLDALGFWQGWNESYGETGARARVTAYRRAIFDLFGRETWVVFGGEGGAAEHSAAVDGGAADESREAGSAGSSAEAATNEPRGDVALMLYVRDETALMARVTPLAKLVFPDFESRTSEHRGVKIYEFLDSDQGRAITVAPMGGWICVVLRGRGVATLRATIDRYYGARQEFLLQKARSGGETPENLDRDRRESAISGVIRPRLFWSQVRRLYRLRDIEPSPRTERLIAKWSERLTNAREIEIAQSGESILNLDLRLRFEEGVHLDEFLPEASPQTQLYGHDLLTDGPRGRLIAQADFSHPFAVALAPLLGFDIEELLEEIEDFRFLPPQFKQVVHEMLAAGETPQPGRIGFSAHRSGRAPIPVLSLWSDASPLRFGPLAPGRLWPYLDDDRRRDPADAVYRFGNFVDSEPTTPSLTAAKAALEGSLWAGADRPPLGFVAIHFDALDDWMSGFPRILLSKDDRIKWAEYHDWVEVGRLAAGSVAIRIDRDGDELSVQIRTLELRSELQLDTERSVPKPLASPAN